MDTLEQFSSLLGLDDTAKQVLSGLPQDLQSEAITTFNSEGSSNVSARFVSFCKKLNAERREAMANDPETFKIEQDNIMQFVQQWSLDERSAKLLESAAQEVRDYVYLKFLPTETTENVNKLFTSFIRKAQDHHDQNAHSRGRGSRTGTDVFHNLHAERPRKSSSDGQYRESGSSNLDMANFIRRFKLDYEASALLVELPSHLRGDVLESFSPPEQEEYSKLFHSFAISRIKGQGQRPSERGADRNDGARRGSRRTTEFRSPLKRERDEDVSEFIARWQLDTDCMELLQALSPAVRADIMRDFSPPANVQNINKSFTGFARSRAGNAGDRGGEQKRGRREEQRTSTHYGGSFPTLTSLDLQHFIQMHGLDNKCQEVLLGLNQRIQAEVVGTFEGCKEGNVNKLFMGFAKMKREMAGRS